MVADDDKENAGNHKHERDRRNFGYRFIIIRKQTEASHRQNIKAEHSPSLPLERKPRALTEFLRPEPRALLLKQM